MRFFQLLVVIAFIKPSLLFSQEKAGFKKQITASLSSFPISIDGELNEEIWKTAQIAKDFVGFEPINGSSEPEGLKTEVKILYDNTAIYIAAKLYDHEPLKILKEITERDNFGISDTFGVYINGFNDGQQDFQFYVSAANGQADCNFTSLEGEDYSWNAIWDSKVKITPEGWVVEMKIPYAALRFPSIDNQTWGINFYREVKRNRQKYTWNFIDNKTSAFSQQAGVLNGIKNIKPPTRLFIIPYTSAYLNLSKQETSYTFKGGLDLKYGLNDSFTLDAILIPDFGQTKFDNVELNLGPFEQQFNENRPFFTEGTDLFTKGNLLYSRRIGAGPSLYPDLDDNEAIEHYPTKTNLLNAIKISGRDNNGLGIGFLNAVTEKTDVIIKKTYLNDVNEEVIEERKETVSPLTNYNVTVLDQRFNQNSSVSFINTNVTRNGSFRDANVTGLLFDLNTKDNAYSAAGKINMSSIFDVKNTNGIESSLYLSENSGNFRFALEGQYISKDFDKNDLGINFQTNYHVIYAGTSYRILKPSKLFNSFRVNLNNYFEFNNNSNYLQQNNINIGLNTTTKKNNYFGVGLNIKPFKSYDYYESRIDNRFLITPTYNNIWLKVSTNYNNKFAFDLSYNYTKSNAPGRSSFGLNISPRYRFNDKFSLIHSISPLIQKNNIGWVDFLGASDEIIIAQRNRTTIDQSLTGKFSINSQMNFNLSVRHYWSSAENNAFYTLQENGYLIEKFGYTENKNSNFNSWNLDLSYSWWFAPGSQATVLYRNNSSDFSRIVDTNYNTNFNTVISNNLNHAFSLSIRYFIDYNQAKKIVATF